MTSASESAGEREPEVEEENEVEKFKKLVEEEHGRAEEYLTRLKYLQADFENYQKAVKRQIAEICHFANEQLVIQLLDVVDNLKRAIETGRNTEGKEALIQGLEITLKKLEEILKVQGVEAITAAGKPFDPSLMEAVERVYTDDSPDDIVAEELRKGYMLKGKVIRPSMVKVAKSGKEQSSQSHEK